MKFCGFELRNEDVEDGSWWYVLIALSGRLFVLPRLVLVIAQQSWLHLKKSE